MPGFDGEDPFWLLPEVEGGEFGELGFCVESLEFPFDDPLPEPAVPGTVAHGPPLGELPGVLSGLFGVTVEGCVLLPGVGGFGEFDPGTDVFGDPLGGV